MRTRIHACILWRGQISLNLSLVLKGHAYERIASGSTTRQYLNYRITRSASIILKLIRSKCVRVASKDEAHCRNHVLVYE